MKNMNNILSEDIAFHAWSFERKIKQIINLN